MTRLLLVRHGETDWNAARRLQGQQDISLSARGQGQAAALAGMVASFAPDMVVTSDLTRTRETAAALGYPEPETDPRWREADLGAWTGEYIDALRKDVPDAYAAWRGGDFTPEAAEPFEALSERVRAATEALIGRGQTVLVITHGGPIRAVCAYLLCLHPKRVVPVSPGSLTVLELPDGATQAGSAKLHTFNWRPHSVALDAPD